MLTIAIPGIEMFDDETQRFVYTEAKSFNLEHTLVSLSLWESKWEKPFLRKEKMSTEEAYSYIQMMAVGQDLTDEDVRRIPPEEFQRINDFIEAKNTATWFSAVPGRAATEVITSEIIYYWMFALGIPKECENWHFNKLITQIKVISEKNAPKKKMSRADQMAQQRALNEKRLQEMGTNG